MTAKKKPLADDLQLAEQLKRSQADYQNLVRRQQEERLMLIKMANKELIMSLIEPLAHLKLASDHIQDQGLSMVVKDLWGRLQDQGLEQIDPLGQQFDIISMEVVDKREGQKDQVLEVVKPGYKLNGEILVHAKVVVGE